jgi:FtsP/CotA-like multicopper oxidase with cupredoxin domain
VFSIPLRALAVLAVTASTLAVTAPKSALPVVTANDNRAPAGILKNDTLQIHLVVRMARWYPEAPEGPFVDLPVFAEVGMPPSIPGPLIRVPEGTTIVASVRNELSDSTVWVSALASRPAADDSTAIKPGVEHTFTFKAGAPGTYFYYARVGSVNWDVREREQLSGAFVVDTPGAGVNDRILMINIYGEPVDSTIYDNALAINGKSWPFTERISASVGDTIHWRVINASIRPHPMHMHGFYFRADSRGSSRADSVIAPERREMAVTRHMTPASTMTITWSPDRPGNWLFHCHFTFHVNEGSRLGFRSEHGDMHTGEADPMKHMSGLVMGITVNDPRHAYRPAAASLPIRKLRLYTNDRTATSTSPLVTSYVLQRGAMPPARDSVEKPAQLIVLTKDQPTEVTIINRAHAATSVHWHGIELESYNDGVAGWSGAAKSVAPMIAPNDSFIARLVLPRAGTFIYHTHLNDLEQITSGAYGPIVVMEAGKTFDPETDHVFTVGWLGNANPVMRIALNGDSTPPPMVLKYGVTHRLRFVNIGAAARFNFGLRQDTTRMRWRPIAKDGADLPPALRVDRPALQLVSTGETFDAEWTPPARGTYMLTAMNSGKLYAKMEVVVR